jgi:hypothetical protein
MNIIDKLKNLWDQLPTIKLDKKEKKETDNLQDQVQTEIKPDGENQPIPNLGLVKEDYILLNTFTVQFDEPDNCFIKGDNVFVIKKADYDVINSQEDYEIKVTFAVVDVKHYFGKPNEYTNFKTDQDIYNLVSDFNQNPPEWMELIEYSDDSEFPRLTTRYLGLNITRIEFPEYNVQDDSMKYYTVTICYREKQTYCGEYEKPVE